MGCPQDHRGDQRHPATRSDQPLDRDVVVRRVRHRGSEADRLTGGEQMTSAAGAAGDPGLVRQRRQRHHPADAAGCPAGRATLSRSDNRGTATRPSRSSSPRPRSVPATRTPLRRPARRPAQCQRLRLCLGERHRDGMKRAVAPSACGTRLALELGNATSRTRPVRVRRSPRPPLPPQPASPAPIPHGGQCGASLSQAHRSTAADDQRRPYPALESADLLADSRLAVAQLARAGGERTGLRDRPDHPQRRRIQHEAEP